MDILVRSRIDQDLYTLNTSRRLLSYVLSKEHLVKLKPIIFVKKNVWE